MLAPCPQRLCLLYLTGDVADWVDKKATSIEGVSGVRPRKQQKTDAPFSGDSCLGLMCVEGWLAVPALAGSPARGEVRLADRVLRDLARRGPPPARLAAGRRARRQLHLEAHPDPARVRADDAAQARVAERAVRGGRHRPLGPLQQQARPGRRPGVAHQEDPRRHQRGRQPHHAPDAPPGAPGRPGA